VRLSHSLRVRAANEPRTAPRQDNDFGAAPLLFRAARCPAQLVVVRKPGLLVLYDRDAIASGPRQRIQIGSADALTSFGTYARSDATGLLYVSNSTDGSAGYVHGLLAFRSTAGCRLALAWQRPFGEAGAFVSAPVVAGGIVYYGDGQGGRVGAFDATTGRPLWDSANSIAGPAFAAPSVAGGRLYVAAWDGRLHAFGP
jgi:outer membrane protein assembly factor BamB